MHFGTDFLQCSVLESSRRISPFFRFQYAGSSSWLQHWSCCGLATNVLLVILASVLSRAINGSAAFFATIGSGFIIVFLHRLLAWAAYYSHSLGLLLKGAPEVIVQDGQMIRDVMRSNHVSEHDLEEDLRLDANCDSLEEVRLARIERSGDISFIKKRTD